MDTATHSDETFGLTSGCGVSPDRDPRVSRHWNGSMGRGTREAGFCEQCRAGADQSHGGEQVNFCRKAGYEGRRKAAIEAPEEESWHVFADN